MIEGKGSEERVLIIDGLRGFALSGLFLVHMEEFFGAYWGEPHARSTVQTVIFSLLAGKTFAVMALCFGFSFTALKRVTLAAGKDFSALYVWRLTLLAFLGGVHGLLYVGDILTVLATVGLLLLIVDRLEASKGLIIVAICFFSQPLLVVRLAAALMRVAIADPSVTPETDVYIHGSFLQVVQANLVVGQYAKWQFMIVSGHLFEIAGWMVLGLLAARARLFEDLGRWEGARRLMVAGSLATAAALYWLWTLLVPLIGITSPIAGSIRLLVSCFIDTFATAVLVLGLAEISRSRFQASVRLLIPVGKMALTLYVLQSVIFVPLLYGFGLHLYTKINAAGAAFWAAGVILLQAGGAALWLRYFRHGPLEWVWRAGVNLDWTLPMRRTRPHPVLAVGKGLSIGV